MISSCRCAFGDTGHIQDPTQHDALGAALAALTSAQARRPDEVVRSIAEGARHLGVELAELLLQDYGQEVLLASDGTATPIDGTAAGVAFATGTPNRDSSGVLWVPLRDGADRVGVVGYRSNGQADADVNELVRYTGVAASLMVTLGLVTDTFARARRVRPMGLAAEMQWALLPPLTFRAPGIAVAGSIEPAYDVGGDVFDYAFDDGVLRLGLFDPMGHGVHAALTASVAVGSYRHGRRRGLELAEIYRELDDSVAEFRPGGFATAFLAELHLDRRQLTFLNAGHSSPRVLRRGEAVTLPGDPCVPCGLGVPLGVARTPAVELVELEPADWVLLCTDGATEQTNPDGEPYGERRLVEMVGRCRRDGLPLEETLRLCVRDLGDWADRDLRDDATLLLVEVA